jgi:protein tyrosine kinase modulator
MTLSQLLCVLRARWRAAAGVLCVVLVLGLVLTLLQPKQYTATATVVLDVQSTDPIAGASMQALAISSYMATQADVMVSERVLSRALRNLGIDRRPDVIAAWKSATDGRGDLESWLVEQALKKIEVTSSRDSNVITLAYTAASPEECAATANAIIKAYIETTIDLRADPAKLNAEFFDARAKDLRLALELAQARLSDYQRRIGVVGSDERLDVENKRLSDLSSQLVTAQAAANESRLRKDLSIAHAGTMSDVQASPAIANLRAELVQKTLELKRMTSRYGERYPAITALRSDIHALQLQINAETRKVLRGITLNDDASQRKVAQLRSELEAQHAKVLRLKSERDRAQVLMRDVENAEQAYSSVSKRTSQTNLESQAALTNVSILKQASPPDRPSGPRILKNMIVAFVLGCVLGVVTAILRERRDQRLRTDDDVALHLRQPLFGVLPKPAGTMFGSRLNPSVDAAAPG